MPIKPENKALYPTNWKEISEFIRFERAQNQCELCGVQNYSIGHRNTKGVFIPVHGNLYLDGLGHGFNYYSNEILTYKEAAFSLMVMNSNEWNEQKYIMIVLTVAHLDHDPTNCNHDNLKAMCQKCHLTYDAKHHAETRAKTKRAELESYGQLSLF